MSSGICDEDDEELLYSASFSLSLGSQTCQSLAANEGSKVWANKWGRLWRGTFASYFLDAFCGVFWLLDADLEECQLLNGTERLGKLEMGTRTKRAADTCGILYPRAIPRSPRSLRP